MKHILTKYTSFIILIILTAVLISCGATISTGGGTSVSNPPTVPSTSLSPDFDDNILETAITDSDASLTLSYLELEPNDPAYLSGPASNWTNLVLSGPFARARLMRYRFERWAEAVATLINNNNSFKISSELQYFTTGSKTLGGYESIWRVGIALTDEDLIKIVIKGGPKNRIWGYYLFETDDDGEPLRGVYAFVNPLIFSSNAASGTRLVTMAYDFRNTSTNKMTFTFNRYDSETGFFAVNHLSYQCNKTAQDCMGELLIIASQPPTRSFSSRSFRMSWNDSTKKICAAQVQYDTSVTLGETQKFTGPDAPSQSSISDGECTVATPHWSERVFSPDDLPSRYDDSSSGISPSDLFGDGNTLTSWENTINSNTIDSWLSGEF